MNLSKRSGFTLLEVIIVVIIVAILASVAMPKITAAIHYGKGKEVLSAIPTIRTALDACALMKNANSGNYTGCNTLAAIGVTFTPKYFGAPTITANATGYTVDFAGTGGIGNINVTLAGGIVGSGNFSGINY